MGSRISFVARHNDRMPISSCRFRLGIAVRKFSSRVERCRIVVGKSRDCRLPVAHRVIPSNHPKKSSSGIGGGADSVDQPQFSVERAQN